MARSTRRVIVAAATVGVVSAGAFLAIAEFVALLIAREGSPLFAMGSFVIDVVPRPIKEFAISAFGDMDKPVLLGSLGVAAAVAAAIAGILQYLRPHWGVVVVALVGVIAGATVVTRAEATAISWLPTALGTIGGIAVLLWLTAKLRRWQPRASTDTAAPVGRRGFLLATGLTALGAVVVATSSRLISAASSSVEAARAALRLPEPRSRVEVPAGAELDVDGLSALYTPNADFYRVDTALTVPSIDPATWKLSVTGMVDAPFELSFDDLLAMGLDEYSVTLTCVSNDVGGGLVGSAKWLGVPVRDIIAKASPQSDADMVLSRSIDGFTASTPIGMLTDDGVDAMLAVAMNGEALPAEHGFPVRMVVPGLYGYVSATKWLTELKVTRFDVDEAYWTPRGYSAEAPIKMSSRIDTPRPGSPVSAGSGVIAGVAWAQGIGVESVEVSIDDGDWQKATLSTPVNADTWVQWKLDWQPTTGTHYVAVRAVSADGQLQIEERAPIAPDGSSGWQRTLITVS